MNIKKKLNILLENQRALLPHYVFTDEYVLIAGCDNCFFMLFM